MPPLKNLAHEKLVQTYVTHPKKAFNGTYAYATAYPEASKATAAVEATRVLHYPQVQNRLLEVFNEEGIDEKRISRKINELLENPKGSVQLGTVRTILEVRKDIDSASKIGVQINLETEEKSKLLERMKRYSAIISGNNLGNNLGNNQPKSNGSKPETIC